MTPRNPVVVGVDGSTASLAAVAWALREAEVRRAETRIIMVNNDPGRDDELWTVLEGIVERSAAEHPDSEIYPKIARGRPADELVRRSPQAQLVVVGSRGRSALPATLLGSVSTKVATHAHCPVLIVREQPHAGPVVVGVDDSPGSRHALRFAFEFAAAHQSCLAAVRVWQYAEYAPVVEPLESEWLRFKQNAELGLAEQLAGWTELYPTVGVQRIAQRGHPVAELAHAARDARLLVVGHRGRGGFAGLALGSVAAGVIRHAPCTVAVVRESSDEQK